MLMEWMSSDIQGYKQQWHSVNVSAFVKMGPWGRGNGIIDGCIMLINAKRKWDGDKLDVCVWVCVCAGGGVSLRVCLNVHVWVYVRVCLCVCVCYCYVFKGRERHKAMRGLQGQSGREGMEILIGLSCLFMDSVILGRMRVHMQHTEIHTDTHRHTHSLQTHTHTGLRYTTQNMHTHTAHTHTHSSSPIKK